MIWSGIRMVIWAGGMCIGLTFHHISAQTKFPHRPLSSANCLEAFREVTGHSLRALAAVGQRHWNLYCPT